MLRKYVSWFFVFGLCLGLVATAAAQPAAPAPSAPARVEGTIVAKRVRGSVTAQDNRTKIARLLKENDVVRQGETIITAKSGNHSVVLVFSNGAKVNLAADSVLNIEEYLTEPLDQQIDVAGLAAEPTSSSTKLHLAQGELVGNVVKLNKDRGSEFVVQTPVGAAGIRGTTFRVVFRPDPVNPGRYTFTVSKPEGGVEVTLQGATGTVVAPVAVADNQEIVVQVSGTIDATTGAITVTAPPTIVTVDIPPQTAAVIATAAVQAVEAAQAVVVPATPTPTPTPTPEPQPQPQETPTPTPTPPTPEPPAPTPPAPTPPTPTPPSNPVIPPAPPSTPTPPRTTPGAGGPA